ncbi:MAG: hypothetical protein QOD88_5299 [Mycobacterium sp.]|jgi:hypothetical protein|nr:hypothetical protein [Mycobacterium sp.]
MTDYLALLRCARCSLLLGGGIGTVLLVFSGHRCALIATQSVRPVEPRNTPEAMLIYISAAVGASEWR